MGSGLKDAARTEAKVRREIAHAAFGPEAATLLAEQFFDHVPLAAGMVIAGYDAIGSEASPSEIMRRAAARGHPVALPCVAAPASPLVFRRWTPGDPLVAGPHGTRHPAKDAAAIEPDLVLVPLLAFDRSGHRLGYGGGYYDRTLASLRGGNRGLMAVGLAFSVQEVTHLPREPEDEPLDWIVTERGARAFSGQVG